MDSNAGIMNMTENISCPLCSGFLIDTITLTMCSHYFCRACLLRHLQLEKTCPTCREELHDLKTAFYPDHTLQDFVYKYAPSTFWKEIRQRADFIQKRFPTNDEKKFIADMNLIQFANYLCLKDEKISLCAEYISPKDILEYSSKGILPDEDKPLFRRYFKCPSEVKIRNLKKLLNGKFDLPDNYVLHFLDINNEQVLEEDYTLQDIVYIFGWDRTIPLKLWFTLARIHQDEDQPPVLEVEMNLATSSTSNQDNETLPPQLQNESHDKMPSLTVNLSSDLFKPESSSSFLNHRVPIITEALGQPLKKRRKSVKKKEKLIQLLAKPTDGDTAAPIIDSVQQSDKNVQILKTPSPLNCSNTTTTPSSTSQSPKIGVFDTPKTLASPDDPRSSSTCSLPVNTLTTKKDAPNKFSSLVQNESSSAPITPITTDTSNLRYSLSATVTPNMRMIIEGNGSTKTFNDLVPNLNESTKFIVPNKFITASSLAS